MSITLFGVATLVFVLLARFVTIWIVNRTPADPASSTISAIRPGDTTSDLQRQVNSKILWDSPDYEVLEWMEEKHSISGSRADDMLRIAHAARKRTIREKALYGAILSGGVALVSGGIVAAELYGGIVFIFRTVFLTVVFAVSAFWFARYAGRLVTGKTDSSAGL